MEWNPVLMTTEGRRSIADLCFLFRCLSAIRVSPFFPPDCCASSSRCERRPRSPARPGTFGRIWCRNRCPQSSLPTSTTVQTEKWDLCWLGMSWDSPDPDKRSCACEPGRSHILRYSRDYKTLRLHKRCQHSQLRTWTQLPSSLKDGNKTKMNFVHSAAVTATNYDEEFRAITQKFFALTRWLRKWLYQV